MYIKAGYGYTVGNDFNRAAVDTPIEIDAGAYALPHHVVGTIAGDPQSRLGFMRAARVRVHVRKDCLGE